MKCLLILCCFLVAGFAPTKAQTDINQALRNMIESIVADLGDPMELEEFEIPEMQLLGLISLSGNIKDLVVEGLDGFVLNTVSFNMLTMAIDFDVTIPVVKAVGGHYDIGGMLVGLVPVFGDGPFDLDVTGIQVAGKASIRNDANGYVELYAFKSTTKLSTLNVNFENLLYGGDLGTLINYAISDLVPIIVRDQPDMVSDIIEGIALEIGKAFLVEMTMTDLINMILEFA